MAETAWITARVQRGAAYLDREQPGWLDRIDVIALDLRSPCGCILGQLHGTFEKAPMFATVEEECGFAVIDQESARWAAEHGFYAEAEVDADFGEAILAEYRALTLAWTDLIERRISGLIAAGVANDGA